MAYEYEEYIKQSVQIELFRHGHHDYEDDGRVIKELEEIYDKAKAFNEIVGLRNNHYIYSKTNSGTPITVLDAKTFGREVSHLININGYMEDK